MRKIYAVKVEIRPSHLIQQSDKAVNTRLLYFGVCQIQVCAVFDYEPYTGPDGMRSSHVRCCDIVSPSRSVRTPTLSRGTALAYFPASPVMIGQ